MLVLAISEMEMRHTSLPDAGTFLATAIAFVLSSVAWFAIARSLALLAQIAQNTARPEASLSRHQSEKS